MTTYRSIPQADTKNSGKRLTSSPTHDKAHTQSKKKYTLLHIIFVTQISFFAWVLHQARDVLSFREIAIFALVPVLQTVWMVGVSVLGRNRQYFMESHIQRSMPILWLPLFCVLLQTGVMGVRNPAATKAMLDHVPVQALVRLQSIRILAVGSLIKWYLGIFPTAFAWLTAFFDMLYGLSAVVLLDHPDWMADNRFLAIWNLVGFVLIMPTGVTVLQLGMAPTQLYVSRVPNGTIFEYPMVLGPAVVVPILLAWNLLQGEWAWNRHFEGV